MTPLTVRQAAEAVRSMIDPVTARQRHLVEEFDAALAAEGVVTREVSGDVEQIIMDYFCRWYRSQRGDSQMAIPYNHSIFMRRQAGELSAALTARPTTPTEPTDTKTCVWTWTGGSLLTDARTGCGHDIDATDEFPPFCCYCGLPITEAEKGGK